MSISFHMSLDLAVRVVLAASSSGGASAQHVAHGRERRQSCVKTLGVTWEALLVMLRG